MKSEAHEYDADFYRFLASFAARSAEQIVPLLTTVLPIDSVADFGCGEGAWLSVWRKAGSTVMGIDGPYVDRQHLMIDGNEFRTADLSQRIDLGRRFDLVQSLEVAEHIPRPRAADFIEMLTDHAIGAAMYGIAAKHGIKYIISGTNIATEHGMPRSWLWHKQDLRNIKAIHWRFGHLKLRSFPISVPLYFPSRSIP